MRSSRPKIKLSSCLLVVSFLASCLQNPLINDPNAPGDDTDPPDGDTPAFSIVRKWYTNVEDDRYYFDFREDGTLVRRYYQDYGPANPGLSSFVTAYGDWRYLDDERTSFAVGWDDSTDRYYNIVGEDVEKLLVDAQESGPQGRGLGQIVTLLKAAATVVAIVPVAIEDLIGTWYYDQDLEGKSIKFSVDGTCEFKYYQNYGGSLSGWVTRRGSWDFDEEESIIRITMPGEVTYSYDLEELSNSQLSLSLSDSNPGGTSMIAPLSQLHR